MQQTFLLFLFVCVSNLTLAQNRAAFPKFLQELGIQMMAQSAHIGTSYSPEKSTYTLSHNFIHFDIFYEGGFRTKLNVHIENGIMKETEIYSDTHWFPTFGSIKALNAFFALSEEQVNNNAPIQQIINYYENLYGKSYQKFNGKELATAILSFNWALYAMEKYNNWSEPPIPSNSNGNLERTIDGIRVIGPSRFTERVVDALELIKEYDPYTYNNFFAFADNQPRLVKGIFQGEPGKNYSTIRGDGYLDIANIHGKPYAKFSETNIYELAGTLLHEMTHLYQFYEYRRLFICNGLIHRASYTHDPIQIAKIEKQAYKMETQFYDKLLKAGATNPYIKRAQSLAIKSSKDYDLLWEAGIHIFEGRRSQPECGGQCLALACEKFTAYNKLHPNDTYVPYLRDIYNCQ